MPSNKFQSAARNYTSSNKFIDDYEKLLKKNTGSRLLFASDTGFDPSYRLTNQAVKAPLMAEGGLSAPEYSTNYQPTQRDYPMLPEVPEGEVLGDWTLPENPTAEQMLQAIFQASWEPELPSSEELEQRYQQTGQIYPVMSNEDGSVTYNDGSVGYVDQSEPPMPIASMADGTVLWSDGFTREMPPGGLASYLAGISGLSQFIFGEDQAVTQEFGNYNPELYGGGYHQGVDFRTYDLGNRNLFSPVQMEVVQVITEDTGSPYGNSVLLRLPSGEMIRLSHLSSLGEFTEGSVLNPGDLIGIPGSTGSSTAEHLDVEYYNLDGQLDNPNNFRANVSQYSVGNQIVGTSPYQSPSQPPDEPDEEMSAFTSPLLDTVENVAQKVTQPIRQAAQQTGKTIEQGINQWNPTGELGLGISETLGGDPVAARREQANTISAIGDKANVPEMGVSEAALKGGLTGAVRQLAGNTIDTLSTPFKKYGLPDTGLSEAIAGGRTINTGKNLAPQSFAYDANGNQIASQEPDYAGTLGRNLESVIGEAKKAGGNLISNAAKSVDDYADQVTAKAGEGVSQLKKVAQNIFKKPQVSDIGAKKIIGEDGMQGENQTPPSLLDMNKVGTEQDNRDAFFKYGGAETYKDYLNPGINSGYRGALNFNLFKDSVFDSSDTVGNIFGNTYLGEEATGKYKARETAKYPLMSFNPMGYEDGYDSGEIDKYNNDLRTQTDSYNKSVTDYLGSIPKVFSGTNWQMGTPKSAKNAFSNASLAYKTPQMSVEKPQMSMAKPQMSMASAPKPKTLMSMAKPQMSVAPAKPQMSVQRPQVSTQQPQMSMARPQMSPAKPQMSMAPKPIQKTAPMSYAKPQMSVAKKAPYPIASMANGKIRYSDGSIR